MQKNKEEIQEDIDLENKKKELNLPSGFKFCKNQNSLKKEIKKIKLEYKRLDITVNIKSYPCLVIINDMSLECGRVYVDGLCISDFEKIISLMLEIKNKKGKEDDK